MIDRHRTLIHILLSGLVGLTFGLSIGWWVWPVEWTEGPTGQPVATAPIQAGESPVEGGAENAAEFTSFQDRLNQGLLFLAAALLLVGGVVIGYQLLRQSQKAEALQRSTASADTREAAAPRGRRARPAFFRGGQSNRRLPGLSWIRGAPPAYGEADDDEPVFPAQPVAGSEPAAQSPVAGETVSGAFRLRNEDTEAYRHLDEADDLPETGQLSDSEADWSGVAAAAVGERLESEQDEGPYRETPVEDGEESGETAQRLAEVAPAPAEDYEFDPDVEEGAGVNEENRQAAPTVTAPADGQDNEPVESGKSDRMFRSSDASTNPDQPAQPMTAEPDPGPSPSTETGDDAPLHSQVAQAAAVETARESVGAFAANYAFGIQSYDESFTITAADGSLLGACGMGINESLDRGAADTDQVRLLEVWLYDRSAVRSVSQPLVSPGFDVSVLNDRAGDGDSEASTPLELRPGLTCILRSEHIVLECTVKSVTFLDDQQPPRPLRSVSASLVVQRVT